MSTVSPAGSGTEGEQNSDIGIAAVSPPSVIPSNERLLTPPKSIERRSSSLQPERFAADVDVVIPSEAIEDTQTFSLDDTQSELTLKQLAEERAAANGSHAGTDGAVTLDAPAAAGPLDGALYLALKRTLDIGLSLLAMVLLSPAWLISAVLVKLTDGGAVLYPHTRVGEGGSEFTCYKFRSMVINADKMKADLAFFNSHDDHRTFKIPNDPRVTWIGRWMRRTSIDELPQLWNVLRGDMSIVGPRPPVVSEVEQYTWDDMQRLAVKPGLTCIWQISGRSRLPFPEQLKMDLEYIEKRSLALDLKIIALTIPAVLSADGAY